MSLLLEALKKAEKAKEEAQRRAKGEATAPELRIENEPPVPEKPVLTRAELPDIRQPLEILTEEIAPEPQFAASTDYSGAQGEGPRQAEAQAAERATARKVFEAKFREPNPRLPFYLAVGALGVFALGTVGYFWYQLRPPPALVNLNPQRQPETAAVADASTPPAAHAAAPAAPSNAIPGLPPTGARAATPSAPVAAAPAASSATPAPRAAPVEPPDETPRRRPAQRVAEVQPAPAAREVGSSATRNAPQVSPKVEAGYAAYGAGDLAAARSEYEQALRDEPANRDALLGLAAIDVRGGRYESAEALYMRVLQGDPRDSQAQAALISLRSGRSDPLATESRVKSLLAADPSAHALNFALGNQLAQQNRWAEAQQEFFKAYTAEPENADFAYNLAVSLDHLRQPRQALDYYQRAIGLSQKRGASFDLAAAKARASELAR